MSNCPPVIHLASGSPRRRQLLGQIGVPFSALSVTVEEVPATGELPEDYVRRVAREKAEAGWRASTDRCLPVLGADTEVVLDDEIFGKPRDFDHARSMLERLAGRTHRVLSAVALVTAAGVHERLQTSFVRFAPLGADDIEAYWRTGEPVGKAGGYAIQGLAALFIEHLEGSFSGVMGLPLFETAELLQGAGIEGFSTRPDLLAAAARRGAPA